MKLELSRAPRAFGRASLLCFLLGGAANAAPLLSDLTLSTGIGWSDNITGVANNQVSETIATVGVRALADRDSTLFDFHLDLDLQYVDYLRDNYSNELAGTSELNALFAIVPEMLSIAIEDTYGQTQISPFAPATPGTRQNTNLLALGPDVRFDLGGSIVFLGSGRYAREDYQRTSTDNERFQGTAGVYHEFSGRSSLGALVKAQDVNFSEDSQADFSRREALMRYRLDAPRTVLQVDAGRTEFRGRGASPARYGLWSYQFEASRKLSARTTLELAGGRLVSDSGELFATTLNSSTVRAGIGQTGLGAVQIMGSSVVATGDALRNLFGRATLRLLTPRAHAFLALEARQERYITGSSIDRDIYVIYAGASRNLTQRVAIEVDLRQSKRDADTATIVVKDFFAAALGRFQLTPRTSINLSLEYSDRSDNAGGGNFSDRRAWLGLAYSPIAR